MVEFRKIDSENQPPKTTQQSFSSALYSTTLLVGKVQLEESLFYFLKSLRDGRPQTAQPLLVDAATLRNLYDNPHPSLTEALRHCMDNFLVELDPNISRWGELELSSAIWGLVLAVHNCLVPTYNQNNGPDPVAEFTRALVDTLPPARTLPEVLAYHALLNHPAEALPYLPSSRTEIMQALLNLNPLSAVYHLHHHTPPPLTELAAELLRGWQRRVIAPHPWANLTDWLDTVVVLLSQPLLVIYLRRRWLTLPESRPACRNLGLLLEALRRQGGQRDFILEFYEAYEYSSAETTRDNWGRFVLHWPILSEIEQLLSAGSDLDPTNETALDAALHLNRRGNEYFLKFVPLIQLIITEGHPPTDYNHLRDLPFALRPLLDLTTEGADLHLDMDSIEFFGD
jgi:hypothetical protein